MKFYICNRCDARIKESEAELVTFPEAHDQPKLIELLKEMTIKNGDPLPESQLCHKTHSYRKYGGSTIIFCGPLHEETEQEYFIHWSGGKLKHEPKQTLVHRCRCEQRY